MKRGCREGRKTSLRRRSGNRGCDEYEGGWHLRRGCTSLSHLPYCDQDGYASSSYSATAAVANGAATSELLPLVGGRDKITGDNLTASPTAAKLKIARCAISHSPFAPLAISLICNRASPLTRATKSVRHIQIVWDARATLRRDPAQATTRRDWRREVFVLVSTDASPCPLGSSHPFPSLPVGTATMANHPNPQRGERVIWLCSRRRVSYR